ATTPRYAATSARLLEVAKRLQLIADLVVDGRRDGGRGGLLALAALPGRDVLDRVRRRRGGERLDHAAVHVVADREAEQVEDGRGHVDDARVVDPRALADAVAGRDEDAFLPVVARERHALGAAAGRRAEAVVGDDHDDGVRSRGRDEVA